MNKSLLGALCLGVTAVLFFAFWLPAYHEYTGARDILAARRILLKDTQDAQAGVASLTREYSQNSALIAKATLALPKQKQLDYVTSSLQQAAAGSGVQLSDIAVSDVGKSADAAYQSFQLTVELSGKYPEVVDFIGSVEQSLRLYDVNKVDISESSNGLVTATLHVTAYSLK